MHYSRSKFSLRDPAEAEQIFRLIVNAVRAAHDAGLVHRDLKPANVLMHQLSDGTWVPKVADFGLAKALSEGHKSMTTTRTGVAMGTPSFMAPEQIRDASSVDLRADIWALGCILYQLTTGQLAFYGVDIVDVFNVVTQGNYEDSEALAPHVSPRVHHTIQRCLIVDRENRLLDCNALLSTLDAEDSEPIAASTWEGVMPKPRAPEGSLSDGGLIAPASQAISAQPPGAQETATPAASAAQAEDTKGPTPMGWAIPVVGAVVIGGFSFSAVAFFVAAFVSSGAISLGAPCGVADGQVVGVVKAGSFFLRKPGAVWTVPTKRTVHSEVPSADNDWTPGSVTCTLPAGTSLTVIDMPIRAGRAGTWITVKGGKIEFPEPDKD